MALDVVGEAELRRRDAELRRLAAVAQVAGERDLEPAADAEAVDHRHRGLARILDRVQHLVEQAVVLRLRRLGRERFFSNSEMSAPAENASVPAPRNATQRTSGSASKRAIAGAMPRHMASLMALRSRRLVEHDPADRAALFDAQASRLAAGP